MAVQIVQDRFDQVFGQFRQGGGPGDRPAHVENASGSAGGPCVAAHGYAVAGRERQMDVSRGAAPDQYSDGSLRRPTKNGRRETEAAQREPGSDRSRGAKYPAAVE